MKKRVWFSPSTLRLIWFNGMVTETSQLNENFQIEFAISTNSITTDAARYYLTNLPIADWRLVHIDSLEDLTNVK